MRSHAVRLTAARSLRPSRRPHEYFVRWTRPSLAVRDGYLHAAARTCRQPATRRAARNSQRSLLARGSVGAHVYFHPEALPRRDARVAGRSGRPATRASSRQGRPVPDLPLGPAPSSCRTPPCPSALPPRTARHPPGACAAPWPDSVSTALGSAGPVTQGELSHANPGVRQNRATGQGAPGGSPGAGESQSGGLGHVPAQNVRRMPSAALLSLWSTGMGCPVRYWPRTGINR